MNGLRSTMEVLSPAAMLVRKCGVGGMLCRILGVGHLVDVEISLPGHMRCMQCVQCTRTLCPLAACVQCMPCVQSTWNDECGTCV